MHSLEIFSRCVSRTVIVVAVICMLCSWRPCKGEVPSQPCSIPATNPTTQPDPVLVLGKTVGKPIDSGFVFYKGRYIEAPYTVTRAGVEICINDIVVRKWAIWPLPQPVTEDPGLPAGLTERSTLSDIRDKDGPNKGHANRKWRYLYHTNSAEVADQKMLAYYKALPFVADVVIEPGMFRLRLKNGSVSLVSRERPRPGFDLLEDMTPKKLAKLLDEGMGYYEKSLKSSDCFMLFDKGELSFGQHKAARDLKAMVEILRSSQSLDEKRILLQRMSILPPGNQFDSLITGFRASSHLDERIQALATATGVNPITVSEIPKMSEGEQRRLAQEREMAASKKANTATERLRKEAATQRSAGEATPRPTK